MASAFRRPRSSFVPSRSPFRPKLESLEDRCLLSTLIDLPGNPREITVMSRNLYVGTDFSPLFDPAAPGGPIYQASLAWNDVKQTNFPLRAEALADEIAENLPDLIGLQEVSKWMSDTFNPFAPVALPTADVEYDYLEILKNELEERGLHYGVVAEITVFDEELPIWPDLTKPFTPDNLRDFRLFDREVILARTDLPTSQLNLSNPQTGHFAAHETDTITVPGFPPVVISYDRGWASVDAKVRGKEFRFITTHLEPEETNAEVQVQQGQELLTGPANTDLPVILVGDLNSRADGSGTATYSSFIAAGFNDVWTEVRPGELGNTHGHTELLNDRLDTAGFDRRIDFVLYRGDLQALAADVAGEETPDFDAYGMWASDHAGVVAKIGIHVRPAKSSHDGAWTAAPVVAAKTLAFAEMALDWLGFDFDEVSHSKKCRKVRH